MESQSEIYCHTNVMGISELWKWVEKFSTESAKGKVGPRSWRMGISSHAGEEH